MYTSKSSAKKRFVLNGPRPAIDGVGDLRPEIQHRYKSRSTAIMTGSLQFPNRSRTGLVPISETRSVVLRIARRRTNGRTAVEIQVRTSTETQMDNKNRENHEGSVAETVGLRRTRKSTMAARKRIGFGSFGTRQRR